MATHEGTPVWYELITSDLDAAERFYGKVVGWKCSKYPGPVEHDYRILTAADGEGAGGLMKIPDPAMKPVWLGYFGVKDVDAAAKKVSELGGRVDVPPTDIPDVGRFAFVADPQGARFYLMRGNSEQDSTAFQPMADGHCSWNELATSDPTGAFDFYGKLLGWRRGDAMPMGEAGDYVLIQHADKMIGGVMTCSPGGPPPMWTFYFRVNGIEAATRRVEQAGGKVMREPTEVPGGDYILIGTDPQGAVFALVGPKA